MIKGGKDGSGNLIRSDFDKFVIFLETMCGIYLFQKAWFAFIESCSHCVKFFQVYGNKTFTDLKFNNTQYNETFEDMPEETYNYQGKISVIYGNSWNLTRD
jgi:hypothetical protein